MTTQVLIIDEVRLGRGSCAAEHRRSPWSTPVRAICARVALIGSDFFIKLDALARAIRNIDEPYGGIQLVLAGDFLCVGAVRFAY